MTEIPIKIKTEVNGFPLSDLQENTAILEKIEERMGRQELYIKVFFWCSVLAAILFIVWALPVLRRLVNTLL